MDYSLARSPKNLFRHEIERAFVSALWRHPDFIDRVIPFFDPDLYVSDWVYRSVLYSICVTWWNAGSTDWVLVIHSLRELGEYEACGGHEGLNTIYTNGGLYPFAFSDPQSVISEYIDLLIAYHQADRDRPEIPIRYSGGRGKITPNRDPKGPESPTGIGYLLVAGRKYTVYSWAQGEETSLKLVPVT